MGHGKLRKFAENETFRCLVQPAASEVLVKGSGKLVLKDHPIKGNWGRDVFGNDNPIVLELGCGGGEYTIALAGRNPSVNYIGVDIKGARLWKGAKYATENALPNVAFLRTRIEFITAFFAPSEVSGIWLTFSDPQLSGSENSRLSSPMFLDRYRSFLTPGGTIRLKTDSRFLYEYTMSVIRANDLRLIKSSLDVYADDNVDPAVTQVQTFYEKMFLQMGLPITYLAFCIDHDGPYVYPTDFDAPFWRAAEGPRRSFSHQPSAKNAIFVDGTAETH